MPKLKPAEFKCPACKGTGFPAVKQPAEPGRKIYPARCERCDGKGWIFEVWRRIGQRRDFSSSRKAAANPLKRYAPCGPDTFHVGP